MWGTIDGGDAKRMGGVCVDGVVRGDLYAFKLNLEEMRTVIAIVIKWCISWN